MILTDDILLQIFDFYRHAHDDALWEWHILVHVCRRWRQIVFESPRYLDLKIRCTTKTRFRENLSIWPAFPIAIDFRLTRLDPLPEDAIAALENTNRIVYLKLDLTQLPSRTWGLRSGTFNLASVSSLMESKPFPMLKHLIIHVADGYTSVLPDDFLGGSAPRLQTIHFRNVDFVTLQTPPLTASNLVELHLRCIPLARYVLPDRMAMRLADLPRLKTLVLQFQSAFFPPNINHPIHPPAVTRTVLPALTDFEFTGTSKYLEKFIAQIDCPRLNHISIFYLIRSAPPQVAQLTSLTGFLNRSLGPEISPFKHAKVRVQAHEIRFDLYRHTKPISWDSQPATTTVITCLKTNSNWNLLGTLNNFSVILSTVVDLKFVSTFWESDLSSDEHDLEWLPFLHQLSALQALYVCPLLAGDIGRTLKSVKGEIVAEALPCLDLICLEDHVSYIEEFAAVRQLSSRPLTVVGTEAEFDQRLIEKSMMSYTH